VKTWGSSLRDRAPKVGQRVHGRIHPFQRATRFWALQGPDQSEDENVEKCRADPAPCFSQDEVAHHMVRAVPHLHNERIQPHNGRQEHERDHPEDNVTDPLAALPPLVRCKLYASAKHELETADRKDTVAHQRVCRAAQVHPVEHTAVKRLQEPDCPHPVSDAAKINCEAVGRLIKVHAIPVTEARFKDTSGDNEQVSANCLVIMAALVRRGIAIETLAVCCLASAVPVVARGYGALHAELGLGQRRRDERDPDEGHGVDEEPLEATYGMKGVGVADGQERVHVDEEAPEVLPPVVVPTDLVLAEVLP